ncbi:hypothetical protein QZH41_015531, partial [Actinostola sp. cb2023]
ERRIMNEGEQESTRKLIDNNTAMEEDDEERKTEHEANASKKKIFGFDRKYLIPKGFYFFFFSAQGSLLPYLSLFLKQLELPASQVGIVTGIKPYIAFFFIPIWSAVADRYQKSKLLFVISMLAINVGLVAYAFTPIDLCEEDHLVSKKTRHLAPRNSNLSTYLEQLSMMAEDSLDETPWPQAVGTSFQDTGQVHNDKTMGVFLYLLLVTIFSSILSCPSLTLGDSATVQQLKENNETHKYGKQRLWGSIGWGSMAFLVGAAVSKTHLCPRGSAKRNDVNYYPCFATYGVFMLVALAIGLKLKFDDKQRHPENADENNEDGIKIDRTVKSKTKGILEGMWHMLTPRHTMFLVTVFIVGICMGLIKVFLFWHLKDLGGTQLLFSYMSAVNCIAEVSVYFLSSKLISRIGHIRVLYLGLLCYSIRLFFYAYVKRPWYVLPIEALSGITTAAVWASLMSYVGIHSFEGVNVTLQGILHSVHWGLGHGCGEFVGGFFISAFGASKTFALFGTISLFDLIAYILVDKFAAETKLPADDGYIILSHSDIESEPKKQ